MPHIVQFDGLYKLPDQVLSSTANERFDYIFEAGVWGKSTDGIGVSGAGSTIESTELYRDLLGQFLDNFSNKPKFFDAPCGDLNWVQGFTNRVEYIGGDISGQLIAHLRALNPELELMHFDITKDVFPRADIWHCRHCLFHLSLNDVYLAFNNFCKSDVSLALISNHFLPDCVTFDIPTGSFRFLHLTNFPFYLPKPDLWLMDTPIQSGKCSLASGIWTHAQIAAGAENYRKNLGL